MIREDRAQTPVFRAGRKSLPMRTYFLLEAYHPEIITSA